MTCVGLWRNHSELSFFSIDLGGLAELQSRTPYMSTA
jgi:hypothetical protein